MKLSTWFLATLAMIGIGTLAACGGGDADKESSDGRETVTFLTMQLQPTFNAYFEKVFAEFEAQNPGVKVEWIDYPYQNYETKLMTSFRGGKAPDVINIPSENLTDYINRKYIVTLNELVAQEVRDTYVQSILNDGCVYDGQVFALPWYASSAVCFYNRALFDKAGLSLDPAPLYYEQLPAIAAAIKEKAGAFATFPMYTEQGAFRRMLWEAGVPLLNEDETKAVFNTPRALEVLTFWTDLYKNGLVPSEALAASHRRPIELFNTGNLAIMATGPQFIRQVKADAPDVYENTTVGRYMIWEGRERFNIALHTLAVSSQAKNPQLAAKLAAFVTNGPNQLEICKLTTILPSVSSALDDPYFTDPEDTLEGKARKLNAEQTRNGEVFRPLPEARKLNEVFDTMIEQVAIGKMTPAEGLRSAEEKWNAILAK